MTDRLINEAGEGYSRYDSQAGALFDHYWPRVKALEAELFKAEWTPETLAARREAWNAEINLLSDGLRKAIPGRDLDALVKRLGYGLQDIKKAQAMLRGAT